MVINDWKERWEEYKKTDEYKESQRRQAIRDLHETDIAVRKSLYQCMGYTTFDEMIETLKDDISREGFVELIHYMNSLIIESKAYGFEYEVVDEISPGYDYPTGIETIGANNEVI